MSMRSIILCRSKTYNTANKLHRQGLEHELNTLRNLLDKAFVEENMEKVEKISKSIDIIQSELEPIRMEESKRLADRARCKWYDEGEKSNKYFLNIIKKKRGTSAVQNFQRL